MRRRGLCAVAIPVAAAACLGVATSAHAAHPDQPRLIAFVREGGERGVWVVDASGAERRLTRGLDYRPAYRFAYSVAPRKWSET